MKARLVGYVLAFLMTACTVVAVSGAVYDDTTVSAKEISPVKSDGENVTKTGENSGGYAVVEVDGKAEENSEVGGENSTTGEKSTGNTAESPTEAKDGETATESATESAEEAGETEYVPRTTAPDKDNLCYYSDENIFYAASYGMPNCTCYAWGRAYELTGVPPELSPYDACTWYGYNEENGYYDYGDEPEVGAIACFAYSDGGSGHVAVVEKVEGETVTLSNSAYSGTEFYTETVPTDDPANGKDGWIFQGYIYLVR